MAEQILYDIRATAPVKDCSRHQLCLFFVSEVPPNHHVTLTLESDGCYHSPQNRVVFLEHVQAVVTLSAARRGEVQVFLKSPAGTLSTLLAKRVRDMSSEGFNAWAFMTTQCWGESSEGSWELEVHNGGSTCK